MLNLSYLSLFVVIVLYIWTTPSFALKKSYIVYMGEHSDDVRLSKDLLHNRTESHLDFLGSFLGSKKKAKEALFYSYRRYINGFAAQLDEDVVAALQKNPKVVSVFPNEARKFQTTRSWEFMSLEKNGVLLKDSLWRKARYGKDVIVANIDGGVWPESPSFSDDGYGPIPSRWKGRCELDGGRPFPCNRKLIGAKYFYEGYAIDGLAKKHSFDSARDYDGHGTHTLSTAGGNIVKGASVAGFYNGTAKGGAPLARVAAYKVCWPVIDGKGPCYDADILKAFDHAINDGVDVISVSLSGGDVYDSANAIGAFHAVRRGIVVVAAAGNDGPTPRTSSNLVPWIITVGASTTDRGSQAYVQLQNGKRFKGASLAESLPQGKFYSLVGGVHAKANNANATEALLCKKDALDPEKVKGKILICLRGGGLGKQDKGGNAASAGAIGMIFYNDEAHSYDQDAAPQAIPSVHVSYNDGLTILAYINSTRNPMGLITPPNQEFVKPAPVVASFSSRGPNTLIPQILKPDITAPGVAIMAAFTEGKPVFGSPSDTRKSKYTFMSGTSMACPHVAGVVALLKAIHPLWSPAAIRSAIMTTASTTGKTGKPILDKPNVEATPFAYGAGHIRPNLAADPGLVYDLKSRHYTKFLCTIGLNETMMRKFTNGISPCNSDKKISLLNLNYPSITVPKLSGSVTVKRILKNVGSPGKYTAKITAPVGVAVSIQPSILEFTKDGSKRRFFLTVTRKGTNPQNDYVFGELIWSDGKHNVRSPIVVGPV